METVVNLDRIRPGRLAGYGTNFVGDGWLERVKGRAVRDAKVRATVTLDDQAAQKAMDWMLENLGHAFPYSFVEGNRIIGMELAQGQLAPV
jgi:hypothetical protein